MFLEIFFINKKEIVSISIHITFSSLEAKIFLNVQVSNHASRYGCEEIRESFVFAKT